MEKCKWCKKKVHNENLICQVCKCNFHKRCILLSKDVITDTQNWFCPDCVSQNLPLTHITNDTEFLETIVNIMTDNHFEIDKLDNLVFNPFELNEDDFQPMYDIDPDVNFYASEISKLNECKYYHEDTFNEKIASFRHGNSNLFSIIHMNIRSMNQNMTEFLSYIEGLDNDFQFIGLSETWLNDSNADLFHKSGYVFEELHRHNKTGGGVGILIQEGLQYKCRNDLNIMSENLEAIFIELDKRIFNTENNMVIGAIYRPPGTQLEDSINILVQKLTQLEHEHKSCYLMGDYNVNLLNAETHSTTGLFLQSLYSFNYVPLITKPTRLTASSATIIDNIFTNVINFGCAFHGILFSDITDHFPIFYVQENRETVYSSPAEVTKRNFSKSNFNKFSDSLKNCNWNSVNTNMDTQSAFTDFHNKINYYYNESFPLCTFTKKYNNKYPWMTDAIKNSIKYKNKLFIKYRKNPSKNNEIAYKQYKSKLHHILVVAEKEHYKSLFQMHQGNLTKSWRLIKDIINRNKQKNMSSKFKIDGHFTEDEKKIAQGFNNYFVNVGSSLDKKIPHTGISPTSYMPERNLNSLYIEPVCEKEIVEIIKDMKNSSPGWDSISADIIKKTYPLFLTPLTHICNISLQQGVFPDELKIAKIIPLFKSGDSTIFTNYRPVSVLPAFSKIFEKLMYKRLMTFIEEYKILYKYQFGFRRNHSTSMALVTLIDNITSALDKGEIVLGVFLDFSKAFDTVNFNILFDKLEVYGVRDIGLSWMKSYLTNRKQYVCYNGYESDKKCISCGVPQGSILGPLLFLLYINDMISVSQLCFPLLFADDTNIFLNGPDITNLFVNMNNELSKLMLWLQTNRLSLNISKTHYMVFKGRKRVVPENISLTINDEHISEVQSTKFLGVQIDSQLSWSDHIEYIKKKISKGIGIIKKARNFLNIDTLKILYYSFIYPYITYCIEVWGKACDIYLNQIDMLQKRCVRILSGSSFLEHTMPLFQHLKILTVRKVYLYRVSQFMFKYSRNLLPTIFQNYFAKNSKYHHYNTKQADYFRIPLSRQEVRKRSISIMGVKVWNHLCQEKIDDTTLMSFKKKVKNYLNYNNVIV